MDVHEFLKDVKVITDNTDNNGGYVNEDGSHVTGLKTVVINKDVLKVFLKYGVDMDLADKVSYDGKTLPGLGRLLEDDEIEGHGV